jgi:hypothetical protein
MNINAIRDADAQRPGFPLCGYGGPNWPGAAVLRSKDGGASYEKVAALTFGATMGTINGTLGGYAGHPDEVDAGTTVTVTLGYDTGRLAGVPYDSMLAGLNIGVFGNEIIFFQNAQLVASRQYKISGMLRGRRGTEWAINSHTTNERFVLYEPAAFRWIDMETADIGVPYKWKVVSVGHDPANYPALDFTYTGANLKPYAPCGLVGVRDSAGNLTIGFDRRNRIQGEWRDWVDVPMSEAVEAYEVDIYSDGSFSTVLRTLTSSTTSVAYSAANQLADFGSLQSDVNCAVYQMSQVVGRGYPVKGSI